MQKHIRKMERVMEITGKCTRLKQVKSTEEHSKAKRHLYIKEKACNDAVGCSLLPPCFHCYPEVPRKVPFLFEERCHVRK